MVKESEFKIGINYTKCGKCDEWYAEGDGCPTHNPWKKARKKPVIVFYREPNAGIESIQTREGNINGFYGYDYIIRGVEGELYPIKKSIFDKTYVKVLKPYKENLEKEGRCDVCGEPVPLGDPMCESCYQWMREGVY